MNAVLVMVLFTLALTLIPLLKRIPSWVARTGPWIWSLMSSGVRPTDRWGFNDFLAIAGFILTVIGILVGWRAVKLENTRTSLESQIKDLGQSNAELQQRLRDASVLRAVNFAPNVDIHLEIPRLDSVLTGVSVPDFQWQYTRHSDNVNYLVEVVKLDSAGASRGASTGEAVPITPTCNFDVASTCKFVATNPAAQRTQVLLKSGRMSGKFLWRVVPALNFLKPGSGDTTENGFYDSGDGRLSEWSEYGSFAIYPDLVSRLQNGPIIVGTTYSDNNHFSTIDRNGRPRGHDIDLIRLLIEGCLAFQGNAVVYDKSRCTEAAIPYQSVYPQLGGLKKSDIWNCLADYSQQPIASRMRESGASAYIRAFPTVEAGLAAVRRKEVDVFIGAVTKAAEREKEGLRFTDGYYTFRSALYAHDRQSLEDWAQIPRSIGVIANSTNHWLATALSGEASFGSNLTITAFPSYWALKNSFEDREIDGLLIDSVLGNELLQTKDVGSATSHYKLTGLEQTSAWQEYYKRLGYESEEFAIAIASEHRPGSAWRSFIKGFFYLPADEENVSGSQDLYNPLEAALESPEIQFILPALRQVNCVFPPEELQ